MTPSAGVVAAAASMGVLAERCGANVHSDVAFVQVRAAQLKAVCDFVAAAATAPDITAALLIDAICGCGAHPTASTLDQFETLGLIVVHSNHGAFGEREDPTWTWRRDRLVRLDVAELGALYTKVSKP